MSLFLFLNILPMPLFAQEESITIDRDEKSRQTRITIPAPRGRIGWGDIVRGLELARGEDEEDLAPPVKGPTLRVTGLAGRWVIAGMNLAMGRDLHVAIEHPRRGDPQLVVTMNREALLSSRRRLEQQLRDSVLRKIKFGDGRELGLQLDDGWESAPIDKPLVIAVHGLYSKGSRMDRLLDVLRDEKTPCGRFEYSSRAPIEQSCERLAAELADLAKEHPRRKVSLVAFSMGGLVARGAIEDPALDPGNVDRLLMIATPNHGSNLAEFNFGLTLWRYASEKQRREEAQSSSAAIEDALAGASVDLRPRSAFLTRLNARPRNPEVQYSLILGDNAFLTTEEVDRMAQVITSRGRKSVYWQFFGDQLKRKLLSLEEAVHGKGDGGVALKRGRLEGVDDTIVLHFRHSDVWGSTPRDDVEKIDEEVLRRLRR